MILLRKTKGLRKNYLTLSEISVLLKFIIMKALLFLLLVVMLSSCSERAANEAAAKEFHEVYSESMDRTLGVTVVLPGSYQAGQADYPVIYLLHGATGNNRSWTEDPVRDSLIHDLSDQYGIIFVMPDGDPFSFYIDSPWNPESQFETFVSYEVVSFIDDNFRTVAGRDGRAITGLSMGGHGALYLSARNPGLYSVAGSMSGADDIDAGRWNMPEENIRGFMERISEVLGSEHTDPDFLSEHSVSNMTGLMKENGIPLIIDCGIDDFLLEANRMMNSNLSDDGVPHDYIERPGRHDWPYWTNAILYQVLFISEVFRQNGVLN